MSSYPLSSGPAARPIPWLRLVGAWSVTFVALPYLWGRTLIWGMLTGQPDRRVAAITAVVILCLMFLTWGARTPGRGVKRTWPALPS